MQLDGLLIDMRTSLERVWRTCQAVGTRYVLSCNVNNMAKIKFIVPAKISNINAVKAECLDSGSNRRHWYWQRRPNISIYSRIIKKSLHQPFPWRFVDTQRRRWWPLHRQRAIETQDLDWNTLYRDQSFPTYWAKRRLIEPIRPVYYRSQLHIGQIHCDLQHSSNF